MDKVKWLVTPPGPQGNFFYDYVCLVEEGIPKICS